MGIKPNMETKKTLFRNLFVCSLNPILNITDIVRSRNSHMCILCTSERDIKCLHVVLASISFHFRFHQTSQKDLL